MTALFKKGIRAFLQMSVQVRASMAFMAVNFMQKGISFLTAPVFTRLLTTEEYGRITVYSSWLDVIGIFAMFGLCNNVFYNGIIEYKNDRNNFTFSLLTLSNVITLFVFAAVWTVNKYVFRFLNVSDHLILFMFFTFLLEPAFEFWKTRQRFDFKYRLLCVFMLLVMVFSPACAIAGIFLFPGAKVEARVVGAQLMTLSICAGCYLITVFRAEGTPKLKYWKYAFLYNLPLIPYFLSTYILSSSDRLMIAHYCGEDKAGIYGIAYTMSAVVNIIWSSVNATMIPTIYKRCEEKRMHTLSEFVNPVIMAYASICIMIMLMAPEVIAFLAPSSYGEGMYVIPAIVGGVFYMSIFSIFSNVIYYHKRPKYVMGAGVAAAAANFILNMIFIPTVGYLAAGYTTLAAYLVEVLWAYAAMKKVTGSSVYDMKKLVLVGCGVLATAAAAPLLYPFMAVRVILLAGLFWYLWKNRNDMIQMIWRKRGNE